MKVFVKAAFLAGVLASGAIAAAPDGSAWFDEWYKAKYGRPSPREEARINAERQATAYREEPAREIAPVNWFEQWFKAKYGRNSPQEDARIKAEGESSAFREEPAREIAPNDSFEQRYRAKYGRAPR